VEFGHALLFLVRGQPVVYYGDEQGMIGRGGNDMQAREDMFAAQAPDFKNAALLGTTRTGADDKFDPAHPFYRFIASLATLRNSTPALSRGAMLLRPTDQPAVFAFSRIERHDRVEYLAAFNNSRTVAATVTLQTSQPAGTALERVLATGDQPSLTTDAQGRVQVTLAPLHFAVWRAGQPLAAPGAAPGIAFTSPGKDAVLAFPTRTLDGNTLVERQELGAELTGSDGLAEVTFTMVRASRPGQYELLGTDDAAPYRIFWRPPADLAPGEELSFIATVDDLRGHRAATRISGLKVDGLTNALLAATTPSFGVHGATVPVLKAQPAATITLKFGAALDLALQAEGSGPLTYQWMKDGEEIPGATEATYRVPHVSAATSGHYRGLVRGLAGSVLSGETLVTVTAETAGRLETLPAIASTLVPSRRIDVWLPPGYDTASAARYPVLYMHDGQNLFDPARSFGGSSWEIDQVLCRLLQEGRARAAIIVGIWNTGMGRFPEYMPRQAVTGESVPLNVAGQSIPTALISSDAYLKFLVMELKPLIDRTYRTKPGAADTLVMGSSMGGLISAYAVTEYPAVFGAAGCVSTHWPAGDGAMVGYLAEHLPKPGANKFYFDYGTETLDALYEPFQQKVDTAMRAAGYTEGRDWLTKKFPGADHSEKSWRQRVDIPLVFLLGT
jgi:predicted alpha/beta superfamily hydrolase